MAQIGTVGTFAEGNTKPPRNPTKGRKWCFTLNNYTEEELGTLISDIEQVDGRYIIGEEVGEQGTAHLQGFIEWKNARAFGAMKKLLPKAHWEKAKGSLEQNKKYCEKDGKFHTNIPLKRRDRMLLTYAEVEWKDWQQDIIDIVEGETDDRTFNWFYETTGNVGKSFLSKYLVLKYDAIIADGKKADVFSQIKIWMDSKEDDVDPKVIVLDIPRTSLEYVNYGMLEMIKNGMIYSGKYEGGCCIFPPPHLIIFANEKPVMDKISIDRWNIVNIGQKKKKRFIPVL